MVAERKRSRWNGKHIDRYAFSKVKEIWETEEAATKLKEANHNVGAGHAAATSQSSVEFGGLQSSSKGTPRRPSERSPLQRVAFILFERRILELYESAYASILTGDPYSEAGSSLVTRIRSDIATASHITERELREQGQAGSASDEHK